MLDEWRDEYDEEPVDDPSWLMAVPVRFRSRRRGVRVVGGTACGVASGKGGIVNERPVLSAGYSAWKSVKKAVVAAALVFAATVVAAVYDWLASPAAVEALPAEYRWLLPILAFGLKFVLDAVRHGGK